MSNKEFEASKIANRVIQSRAGGKVERCHGFPHHGSYSVAAHSWGVAMLMHYLWPEDFAKLGLLCLSHDVPEAWVGDIPAPMVRYALGGSMLAELEEEILVSLGLPDETSVTPEEHQKLKACDRLEFYIWAREQLALGNQFVRESLGEIERYFEETPLPDRAAALYEALKAGEVLPRQQRVIKEMMNDRQRER